MAIDAACANGTTGSVGSLRLLCQNARFSSWWYFLPLPLASYPLDQGVRAWGLAASGVALGAACLAVAYFVNNLADRMVDRDPVKNPCIGFEATEGWLLYAALVSAAALLGGFMVNGTVGFAVAISVLAGWMYSHTGRLKQYPVLGTLANLGIFTPLCLLCSQGDAVQPYTISLMVVASILVLQNQLLHEMMDANEDRGRVMTTFLWCGRGPTLGALVVLGAFLLAWLATHLHPTFTGLLCLATFVVTEVLAPWQAARHTQDAESMRQVRVRIRTLGAVGGVLLYLHILQTGGR